jgi:ATP-dependent DNA helicase RecG
MDIVSISLDDVERLLSRDESHFLDYKAREIAPSRLTKTISAFANADGGEILLGIAESRGAKNWIGFDSLEGANAHVQLLNQILPLGQGAKIQPIVCDDLPGVVLQIEIEKNRDIIRSSDSGIYVRRGAQNLPLQEGQAIERLRLTKGISSFETQTIKIPEDVLTNSVETIEFMLEIVPHQEPERWLKKQNLIVDQLPTVAGTILFAEEPQAFLPKRCGVKVYRYRTNEDEGTRESLDAVPSTVEGCLYKQIYSSVAATKEIIEAVRRMTPTGLVDVEYPQETLHEIITNALLHRDYSIPDDVHIRIYDNRVEIESPGRLPGHITPQNILDERFARNGNIVRIVNKFPNPPNKDVGEGLNTAFRAMQQLRLKQPEITQGENSVLVTIRHEQLASPEELIMRYLESHESINNGIAREICVIREDWRIRTLFNRLSEAGMIEKVPGSTTSNTAYRMMKV